MSRINARVIIDHARVESKNHKFNLVEPLLIKLITQSVSGMAINFGIGNKGSKRKPMARPFGVAHGEEYGIEEDGEEGEAENDKDK